MSICISINQVTREKKIYIARGNSPELVDLE